MKKSILFSLSCLVVLVLVLTSCTTTPATTTTPVTTTTPATTTTPVTKEPQYGGVFTTVLANDVPNWDEVYSANAGIFPAHLIYDELLIGDWTKGPAGTGEASWRLQGAFYPDTLEVGCLAESWETPDTTTIVYHIRKGVHFQDKAPVNGREMNANDVVAEIQRNFNTPTSTLAQGYGTMFKSVTAQDKWTVVVKCAEGTLGSIFMATAEYVKIVPTEVIAQYKDLQDWKVAVGTGPFRLTDYVPASSVTLVRNPNYWGTDPLHPENVLPYLDGVMFLIMPDLSTQQAALRTGKIDQLEGIAWDAAANLKQTTPGLNSAEYLQAPAGGIIWMRVDTKPFDDIRVRRAMSLAIDQPAILKSYYGGDGVLLSTPVAPYPEYMGMFTPLEQQSKEVQELYEYHPDKAQQLLTQAGYSTGFTTQILLTQANVSMASVLVDYWAKVGITVTLNVKDTASITAILRAFNQPALYYGGMSTANPPIFWHWREPTMNSNYSRINDARCLAAWNVINTNYIVNTPAYTQAWKDIGPYILSQAWDVELPTPYLHVMWQPWVGGYHGESTVGYAQSFNFIRWIWIDKNLKKEMTGK